MLEYPPLGTVKGETALRTAAEASKGLFEPSDLLAWLASGQPASAVHDGWTEGAPGAIVIGRSRARSPARSRA